MAHLSVSLLGPFQVARDGHIITEFESDKVRALLAYLGTESDHEHRRDAILGLLWPDQPQRMARNNLRQALFKLRQAISDHQADPPYLLTSRDSIGWNGASSHWIDVAAFMGLLTTVQSHAHQRLDLCEPCLQRLHQAADLYRGPFLEQLSLPHNTEFEEWLLFRRESFQRRMLVALGQLTAAYEARRAFDIALRYAHRQVALEPWREESHRQLMHLLALTGQRSDALAQYEVCRRLLEEELGVEPAPETNALYEQIRQGALPGAPGPAPRALTQRPPLPTPLTPFIGREVELAQLNSRMANPDCRLLSLVGPGGIGKTRLALQFATQPRDLFPDGIYFAPLAAARSPDVVLATVAEVLQIAFYDHESPRAQLVNYLRERALILILDNFEHLLDARDIVLEIVQQAPRVKVLVTSIERLNLPGEWLVQVRGMDYPTEQEPLDIERFSALRLFVQSAQRVVPDFAPDPDERQAIVRICQLVEGLPLGIELAASWVRVLSCVDIAGEIEQGLGFLTTALHHVPERHRSLRAVLEHSWQLLSEAEQRAFRRLAIFRGGFSREAAEQIVGATLLTLSALVDKSLLRRTPAGRYDLHAVLRQFAAEKLDEDPLEKEKLLDRYGQYYATFLHKREDQLKGEGQREALAAIGQEIANVRNGWRWLTGRRKFARIGEAAGALYSFYELQGWLHEGEAEFARAIEALGTPQDGAERAILGKVLARQGGFCRRQGRQARAVTLLNQSLAIAADEAPPEERAFTLRELGLAAFAEGENARARSLFQESLALSQASGDAHSIAMSLNTLGLVARMLAEYDSARPLFRESLAISQRIGDRKGMSRALGNLGVIAGAIGDYPEAKRLYQESLDLCIDLGDQWGIANFLDGLGYVASALGEFDEARSYFTRALVSAMEIGAHPLALHALFGMAELAYRQEEPEAALELLPVVLRHPAAFRETVEEAQKLCAAIEAFLPPEMAAAALARGAGWTLETHAAAARSKQSGF